MRTPARLRPPTGRATAVLVAAVLAVVPSAAAGADAAFAVPKPVRDALAAHCADCHGEKGKGNVSLVGLEKLSPGDRLDLLNKVQDQLFFRMMPPATAEQPPAADAAVLRDWVRAELRRQNASKLDDRLPYPDAGNYVDHAALFDGSVKDKPYTPARRWLVSPHIFHTRVSDVFFLDEKQRTDPRRFTFRVANPFLLPEHAGVRDYDLNTLDGSHLVDLLANADTISTTQLGAAKLKSAGVTDPKQKAAFPPTPAPFEAVVLKKDAPTEAEIRAAVTTQFESVLRRRPTDAELKKYVPFTTDAIRTAGNYEGLRQLLKAVLLESEFYYRLELGAGTPDEHGRRPLAPREAAYAISYALGDRGPDAALLKAADSGKLVGKADYEREVVRLLNDKTYFAGKVDPALGYNTLAATHPRLHRFFREFFGYPAAVKIFKDVPRSGGVYANADRGNFGTPGQLVDEADRVVGWVLDRDKAVFETLLTTDKYFVYHTGENARYEQQVANWKAAYEALKNTDWKKDPEKVAADHADVIKKYLDPKGLPGKPPKGRHANSVVRVMTHFENTFGRGKTPFTTFPWAHGNRSWYSPLYNLGPTPAEGSYGTADFDFQPTQPFAVPHRKGILTHPAWLIAFAANTQSDPIRRGRWIREKLLAGVVPDVPITVDAKIPDDPNRSLRERVHSATRSAACTKCHDRMNDLGYPLEQFDDFGRFRTVELLEHPDNLIPGSKGVPDTYKTKPIDPTGVLTGTGDPKLDGPVRDSFDLIDRLARSERVRQSIIRHAFRFFMGRNELPSDSRTLIDADRAYVTSGGSFRAVVVSLLTSDSFIYRKPTGN